MVIIKNSKHNTKVEICIEPENASFPFSKKTVQKIRKALCNDMNCDCQHKRLCQVGPQDFDVVYDQYGNTWLEKKRL